MQRRQVFVFLLMAASQLALAQNQAPELPLGWTPKKPISTRHDMVAAADTSGVHAIVRTKAGWIGGADPRREGAVAGD